MLTRFAVFSRRIVFLSVLVLGLAGCGSDAPTKCLPPVCPIGPGPEFLLATTITGSVVSLKADQQTGALAAAIPAPGPAVSLGLAAVGSKFLYVSDAGRHALNVYSINPSTGALTAVPGSPFSLGTFSLPIGLAARPGGDALYAADAGGVDALSINATTGVPTAIPGSPFSSGSNLFVAVDPAGKFLFTSGDDPPGGIFAFTIDATTGALTAVPGSPFPIPGQTVLNSRPSGLLTDSTGRFVYAALTATNQIAAFSIASGTGVLTPVPGSPFAAGTSPLTLATTGKLLYANSADLTIWGYGIDSTTGALTPVAGSPFPFAAAGLVIGPAGKFLYGSRLVSIEVFSINSTNGTISPVAGSPFPAAGALQLAIVQVPGQGG